MAANRNTLLKLWRLPRLRPANASPIAPSFVVQQRLTLALMIRHHRPVELCPRMPSIYRGRPRLSMFGIGDYAFAPWKAAVSGLHASAYFRLASPQVGRPVVFDDTCYLLPFDDGPSAAITIALLRSRLASDLLRALTFPDSKRPVTKRLLQRLDLRAIALACEATELVADASTLLGTAVTLSDFEAYLATHFEAGQLSLIA